MGRLRVASRGHFAVVEYQQPRPTPSPWTWIAMRHPRPSDSAGSHRVRSGPRCDVGHGERDNPIALGLRQCRDPCQHLGEVGLPPPSTGGARTVGSPVRSRMTAPRLHRSPQPPAAGGPGPCRANPSPMRSRRCGLASFAAACAGMPLAIPVRYRCAQGSRTANSCS